MIEFILSLDLKLFLAIHLGGQNELFDFLAPLFRNKVFWAPLYLFILSMIWFNARPYFWYMVIGGVSLVAATDSVSSKVIKPAVERVRPCNDPSVQHYIRPLVECGSGYSFTSSHATNHFGLACFFVGVLGIIQRRFLWFWWIWALIISLSQVYVGVHYPLDILGGALMGLLLGFIWVKGYQHFTKSIKESNE